LPRLRGDDVLPCAIRATGAQLQVGSVEERDRRVAHLLRDHPVHVCGVQPATLLRVQLLELSLRADPWQTLFLVRARDPADFVRRGAWRLRPRCACGNERVPARETTHAILAGE